jgi:uncharacterized protein (TIGR02284 family)
LNLTTGGFVLALSLPRGRTVAWAILKTEDEMPETDERNGEALNWLLEGANDSAKGFRQGASLARNLELKTLFSDRAGQREQLASQIATEVRSFAQTPSDRGTIVGAAHQAFISMRDAISHESDEALVDELLRRERTLAHKFQSAVDDPQMPSRARSVAADAVPKFTEAADELAALNERLIAAGCGSSGLSGRFELTDDDHRFLALPEGSALLSAGVDGTESVIQRAADAVVRVGIQSVAVATSEGGSLSVVIEAGGVSSKGRDGPAPIERHLTAGQTMEVLVKAGDAVTIKASASCEEAELLRTVVWSLDVNDTARSLDGHARTSTVDAAKVTAAEDVGGATPI